MPPQRRHLLWARGLLVGVGVAGGGWYLRSHDSVFSKCRVDDAAAAAAAAAEPQVGGGGGALLTLPPATTASPPVGSLRLWLFRVRVVLRAALLLSQVVPLLWACVLHTVSPRLVSEATLHDLMLAFFKGSGPCLLKLGQWAATRPDKFSKEFCEVVGRLHHSVPRHSWRETRAALGEAYGGDAAVSALFESVEETPLHSGCIAQVHRARLRGVAAGEGADADAGGSVDVVLKVMHPGVRDSISLDLAIVRMAVTAVSWVVPRSKWLSLHEMCTEFEVLMLSQLDMRAEARNLARFGAHFASDASVVVPRANEALTTADVLVETYEEGALLGVWQASERDAAVRKAVGLKGCRAFLKMVFEDNFFHADMHPGNMLVREDPTGGGDHKIVLLDAGLVSHLAARDKRNFVELFAAVCVGDGRLAADLILAGAEGADECTSPEAFREGMSRIVDTVNLRQAGAFQLSKIQIGRVLLDTMDTVRDNHVRLDPNFTTLIVAIVILEGIGRSLDPDLNIFKVAAPYLLPHVEASGVRQLAPLVMEQYMTSNTA